MNGEAFKQQEVSTVVVLCIRKLTVSLFLATGNIWKKKKATTFLCDEDTSVSQVGTRFLVCPLEMVSVVRSGFYFGTK